MCVRKTIFAGSMPKKSKKYLHLRKICVPSSPSSLTVLTCYTISQIMLLWRSHFNIIEIVLTMSLNHGTLPDSVKEGTQIALRRQRRCADDDNPNGARSAPSAIGAALTLDASDHSRTALRLHRACPKKYEFFMLSSCMVVGFAKRFQRIGFAYRLPYASF